jgi:pyruvate/2-oxoglutarate dehydrogenase complex dihydrolipoamide dehydrogenase (E3) component
MKRYDLVVIGTGIAAQTASTRVRAAGRSVAVIDHRPFGGTCALRGCDPKKMLISGAEVVDFARRMHGRGVDGGNHRRPDYRGVPSIAFTLPPIARVGVLESKARDQGLKMRVKSEKASGWYRPARRRERLWLQDHCRRGQRPHSRRASRRAECRRGDQSLRLRHPARPNRRGSKNAIFGYPTGA